MCTLQKATRAGPPVFIFLLLGELTSSGLWALFTHHKGTRVTKQDTRGTRCKEREREREQVTSVFCHFSLLRSTPYKSLLTDLLCVYIYIYIRVASGMFYSDAVTSVFALSLSHTHTHIHTYGVLLERPRGFCSHFFLLYQLLHQWVDRQEEREKEREKLVPPWEANVSAVCSLAFRHSPASWLLPHHLVSLQSPGVLVTSVSLCSPTYSYINLVSLIKQRQRTRMKLHRERGREKQL